MSSFFDIVIAFVAALMAAAFAHFGASEMPSSVPQASVPQAAPAAPAEPVMTPVSVPQPPAPPRPKPPRPNSPEFAQPEPETFIETTALEAEQVAAMAAHEARMRAHEAIIKATEKARSNAGAMPHLSLPHEVKSIGGLSLSEQAALNAAVASHIELMANVSVEAQPAECKAAQTLKPDDRTQALTAEVNPGISLSL